MTSTDRPHEAPDLIGSSRMLVRCRTLSTVDVDRTPWILIYRLFGYSGSSIDVLERLMKLSLKFGGLTTLVAHLLTSRTLGRNPRVLTESPAPTLFLFFLMKFLNFSKSCKKLPHTHFSFSKISYAHPTFLSLLKQCKTCLKRMRG